MKTVMGSIVYEEYSLIYNVSSVVTTYLKWALEAKRSWGRGRVIGNMESLSYEKWLQISAPFSLGRIIRDSQIYQTLWHGGMGLESSTSLHHETRDSDFQWKGTMTIFRWIKETLLIIQSVKPVFKESCWQRDLSRSLSFANKPRLKKMI